MTSPSTSSPATRKSILELPISENAPIYHLKADPLFPTVNSFLALSDYVPSEALSLNTGPITLNEGDSIPPSMARRSRQIREGGQFSFTSPLPLEFPYDLQEVEAFLLKEQGLSVDDGEKREEGQAPTATALSIETCLAKLEPSLQFPILPPSSSLSIPTAFSSKLRESSLFPKATLLSFSHRAQKAFLPQLDIGEEGSVPRDQFIDVVTGKTVLARSGIEGSENKVERIGFAPWACNYGGHQFGGWAGQLGDGRAISILSTPTTEEVKAQTGMNQIEIALKGSGRTPYSRFADGLAVLRSSVREYLGAESMAALRLPTSRALALIGIPSVKVRREKMEGAAIVTRLSESWIRIGNFELQKSRQEFNSLRLLSNYCSQTILKLNAEEGGSSGLELIKETSRRTAIMIAGWQVYGFCHGVMNTDNISIDGKCIDYGPYAFMDIYDSEHVCNHSDEEGRYKYSNQPTMGLFAITKLGNSLAELIGAEITSGKSVVGENWAEAEESEMESWRVIGLEKVELVKKEFQVVFKNEYTRLMRLRFGLLTKEDGDFELFDEFLNLLSLFSLDYSSSIRLLSQFPTSTTSNLFSNYLKMLLPTSIIPPSLEIQSTLAFRNWFIKYESRLNLLNETQSLHQIARKDRMNSVNPRFILRQWVLEHVIASLSQNQDPTTLNTVLEMASEPFHSYGESILGESIDGVCVIGKEDLEKINLCGLGDEKMLGFQCSCSS